MTMYNLIFGESANADQLLTVLGLSRDDFYRYRDCYLTENGEITVYTRGGGNNRECLCSERFLGEFYTKNFPEHQRCEEVEGHLHYPGCVAICHGQNRNHPCYVCDADDDFDETYATFYFRVPTRAELGGDQSRGRTQRAMAHISCRVEEKGAR